MTTLKPIKCGWRWLEEQLNALIDAINERAVSVPVAGGLDIQETPTGTILALSATQALNAGTGSGGGGGGGGTGTDVNYTPHGVASWQILNVVVDSGGGTYTVQQWYFWGGPVA